MRRIFRQLTRKRNVRRMLSGAFLLIAFAELGSHVIMDGQDNSLSAELTACRLAETQSPKADCPEQRRQQQETKNLLDEMTTHMVVLNELTMPHSGIMYRTPDTFIFDSHTLRGEPVLLFHPPKQA